MPAPTIASLPPFFVLTTGMTVRVTALDPTDGSLVAAVSTSNVSLAVDQESVTSDGSDILVSGAFLPGESGA